MSDAEEPAEGHDKVVACLIFAACVVGVFAAWTPWHSLVFGAVEVQGVDRTEGKVLAGCLAAAAALAVYHLAGGKLFPWPLVIVTGAAVAAGGTYVYVMARPESSVHEFVRKALDGSFCSGILVASVATLIAFGLAVSRLRRKR